MGKPLKFTAKQVADALKETRGMIYLAAEKLGCAPNTIYNYANRYESVRAQFQTQRGRIIDTAELKLVQALLNGEPWAVKFALETIGRERGYARKLEIPGLEELLALAHTRGVPASDLFNAMLTELNDVDAGTDDSPTDGTTFSE